MPRPSPPPPKRSTCPNGLLTPPPYPLCRTPCPCLMTQGNAGDVSPTAGLQAGPGCWGRRPSQARSRAVARRSPLQWNKTFERVMRLWLLQNQQRSFSCRQIRCRKTADRQWHVLIWGVTRATKLRALSTQLFGDGEGICDPQFVGEESHVALAMLYPELEVRERRLQ